MAHFIYVHGEACSYNSSTKRWSKLSKCPCKRSSLAVVRGLLTVTGGRKGYDCEELGSTYYNIHRVATCRYNIFACEITHLFYLIEGGQRRTWS